MKRTLLLLALMGLAAVPAVAQSTELGLLVGGSRRFAEGAPREAGVEFADGTFSFANNSFELFWATQLDSDVWLKVKGGRMETIIPVAYQRNATDPKTYRRDEDGELQHIETNIEYRFSEPYGSTGLFAGLGFYRNSPEESDSTTNWGFNAGVNADFPLSRRYGVIVEASYHWVRTDFNPRYLTVGGGLRVSF